jgi:RNA polymerase sigma factor (sigma-70 family)
MSLNNHDLLTKYLSELKQRHLSPDEEKALFFTYLKTSDLEKKIETKKKIIEDNLAFVVFIAKHYHPNACNMDFLDIIACGNLGLLLAFERYDPTSEYRFSTYASHWIRKMILEGIRNNQTVSMSEKDFYSKDVKKIDIVNSDDIVNLLNEPYSTNDESEFLEFLTVIRQKLSELPEKERNVISWSFGFPNGKTLTLKEISKILNCSAAYVSQIKKKALTELLNAFDEKQLKH